jgi:two-component system response regulator HydG
LLAAAIHNISRRRTEPFFKVNCAALNENLLESELFGHVKGAFTGADSNRVGRFEAAHGGTIFLDEIGDLPLATQTKLLRVLQEKEIERVGDHRPVGIDVRVISATHKDLKTQIKKGLFREDLYYRVGVIPIQIPPLRKRQSDIPLLVNTFIKRISEKTEKEIQGISRKALDLLVHYSWPGNIRELENIIEYAFVLCTSGTEITTSHLPSHMRTGLPKTSTRQPPVDMDEKDNKEKRHKFIEALQATGGNQSKAAKMLGVSRVTAWKWMKKYGIEINAEILPHK